MRKKEQTPAATLENGVGTIVGKGSSMQGDVHLGHSLRVDGVVKGRVVTKYNLYLGKGGEIEGEIFATDVVIGGRFKGKLSASGMVHLLAESYFNGELRAGKLVIEDGAVFEGVCAMGRGDAGTLETGKSKAGSHKVLAGPDDANNGKGGQKHRLR